MSRDVAFTAGLEHSSHLMLPVQAPADVWARVLREFDSRPVERLPLRARLL
jgi:hypothetical protein